MKFCLGALAVSCFVANSALAQSGGASAGSVYDDYGSFATDPVELDNETEQLFGRYFQNSFLLGTGIHAGDLGLAYSAGVFAGMRFVFYFDKIWGAELGIGFSRHNGIYDSSNIGKLTAGDINLQLSQTLIPLNFGLRYGFDRDALPRGLAAMNPYLSAGGEVIFRSEKVVGTPTVTGLKTSLQGKYSADAILNDQAFGVALGGGFEFDVYRRKLLMGLDFRYHLTFWPDEAEKFGNLSRSGQYITVLGQATYSY